MFHESLKNNTKMPSPVKKSSMFGGSFLDSINFPFMNYDNDIDKDFDITTPLPKKSRKTKVRKKYRNQTLYDR